jgi:molecular chaperone DnaK (HSP70)
LAYDRPDFSEYRWGCQVDDTEARHEWFKLKIDPTRDGGKSQLANKFPSSTPRPSTYRTANLERLVTDYLSALRKHLDELLNKKLLSLAAAAPREYILTVPAVWSQKARDDTLSFAQNAGMGTKDRIHMITEPEAAALCDLESRDRDRSLQPGEVFIVCDAGGGFVGKNNVSSPE